MVWPYVAAIAGGAAGSLFGVDILTGGGGSSGDSTRGFRVGGGMLLAVVVLALFISQMGD